jgi:enamine deaminase RidA (YjgF/YER057c/UK114 family)
VTRTAVNPWPWSLQFGFSQATLVESPTKVLVCSGQTAIDAEGAAQHAGDMAAQLGLAMANLEAVLADAGMTFADVMRLTVFTTDVDAFIAAWPAAATSLASPAMTLIGISRLAYPELMVEIEAVAMQ